MAKGSLISMFIKTTTKDNCIDIDHMVLLVMNAISVNQSSSQQN